MSDLSNAIVCALIASVASGVAIGSRIGGRVVEVFDPMAALSDPGLPASLFSDLLL